MNFNSFPTVDITDDHDPPNYRSSPSILCRDFFNLSRDHARCYDDHRQFFHPQHRPDGHDYSYNRGGSSYAAEISGKIVNDDLEFTLWKSKFDQGQGQTAPKKIENSIDRATLKTTTAPVTDQKSLEADQFNINMNSLHSPIRVCTDCNTTKTPLWRSGPKGPKSLCNACGIRQRKARRALEAADVGTNQATDAKLQQPKEKTVRNGPHSLHVKKRCKTSPVTAAGSSHNNRDKNKKKVCIEDLLINLSKKLGSHRVFPEEEKDAAILLMALSYGLVHG